VIYSYNKNQRDTLILKFILVKNSTCFGEILLSIIRSLHTLTGVGICYTGYVDCLLAVNTVLRLLMMDSKICPKHIEFFTKINLRNSANFWYLL